MNSARQLNKRQPTRLRQSWAVVWLSFYLCLSLSLCLSPDELESKVGAALADRLLRVLERLGGERRALMQGVGFRDSDSDPWKECGGVEPRYCCWG